jgi:hypothetical protein
VAHCRLGGVAGSPALAALLLIGVASARRQAHRRRLPIGAPLKLRPQGSRNIILVVVDAARGAVEKTAGASFRFGRLSADG